MRDKVMPVEDETQNVRDVTGGVVNGVTTVTFTRDLDTQDADQDFIFTDNDCAHFLYSWGGNVGNNGATFTQHNGLRTFSQVKFCFPGCGAGKIANQCLAVLFQSPLTLSQTTNFRLLQT